MVTTKSAIITTTTSASYTRHIKLRTAIWIANRPAFVHEIPCGDCSRYICTPSNNCAVTGRLYSGFPFSVHTNKPYTSPQNATPLSCLFKAFSALFSTCLCIQSRRHGRQPLFGDFIIVFLVLHCYQTITPSPPNSSFFDFTFDNPSRATPFAFIFCSYSQSFASQP